jgi:putative DNA primase/helicase
MLVNENDIARAKAVPIADLALRRGVKLRRESQWMQGPCLKCGGTDRFFVHIKKNVFGCRGCRAKGDAIDFVMWADGVTFSDSIQSPIGDYSTSLSIAPLSTKAPTELEDQDEGKADRTRLIARLWQESIAPKGTVVERYLARRLRRELPPCLLSGHVLRFHPNMMFPDLPRGPAMVGLYRRVGVIETPLGPASRNESIALHRTMLTADGEPIYVEANGKRKKAKAALGPSKNAAIKLIPDVLFNGWCGPELTYGLGLAEGIETAVAAWLLTGVPTWACGYAANMAAFPVLPGIECLTLFIDNDKAGLEAAATCAERWTAAGLQLIAKVPDRGGADFADVVLS